MIVYFAFFVPGRGGRLIGRGQDSAGFDLKYMLPVSGIAPEPYESYRVRVVRDTRPGEHAGALLVDVLETEDSYKKRQRRELAQAVQRRLQEYGLISPPIETLEEILADTVAQDVDYALPYVRAAVMQRNSPPEPPPEIIAAAHAWKAAEPVATPPEGWRPIHDGLSYERLHSYGILHHIHIYALIRGDGSRETRYTLGRMERQEVQYTSPDEYRSGRYIEEVFCPIEEQPALPPEEKTALEEEYIPWPSDCEIACYFTARRAVEEFRTKPPGYLEEVRRPHTEVLERWLKEIGHGGRYLLDAYTVPCIVSLCSQ